MALALDLPPVELGEDALTYEEEHTLFGLPPALALVPAEAGVHEERSLVVEMLLLAALLLGALCAGAVVAAVGIALTV